MSYTDSTTKTTPRKRGKHLNFEDRCTIKVCRKLGLSLRKTAAVVNCSPSTVSNELKRGTGQRKGTRGRFPEYSAKRGENTYKANRKRCGRHRTVAAENPFIAWVIDCVRERGWSLDACVGSARRNHLFPEEMMVCTKTLYNAVWNGVILSPFNLPEALSRKPRKPHSRKNKRIQGTSIEERPAIVSAREEFGHWEIDTVVGHRSGSESVVLTLVEKVTDYYIAIKIPAKNGDAVMASMETLREEYGNEVFNTVFKTITADNGCEFNRLAELENYGVRVFFAHPYSSWERPQNERHNRIFRRYIPKSVSIEKYTAEEICLFAYDMNMLPRKILDYASPEELFELYLDQIYSLDKRCCG